MDIRFNRERLIIVRKSIREKLPYICISKYCILHLLNMEDEVLPHFENYKKNTVLRWDGDREQYYDEYNIDWMAQYMGLHYTTVLRHVRDLCCDWGYLQRYNNCYGLCSEVEDLFYTPFDLRGEDYCIYDFSLKERMKGVTMERYLVYDYLCATSDNQKHSYSEIGRKLMLDRKTVQPVVKHFNATGGCLFDKYSNKVDLKEEFSKLYRKRIRFKYGIFAVG